MVTATWVRDSHGLFDYESNEITKKVLVTHLNRYLIRVNRTGEVRIISDKERAYENPNDITTLIKITPTPYAQVFSIESCSDNDIYEDSSNKLWLVLRNLKKNGLLEDYKLKRGDIIKLGRVHIMVKDYKIENAITEEDKVSQEAKEGPIDVRNHDDVPKDENDSCRICFNSENNPF